MNPTNLSTQDFLNASQVGSGDQGTLMDQIQKYAAMLSQQQQMQNNAGVNADILGGQQGQDLARVASANSIMGSQLAPIQNWEQNQNSPYALQQSALLAQGPPHMQPMQNISAGTLPTGFNPTAAVQQGLLNQYNNQLGQAHVNAFFDTNMLSPDQMQAKQWAQQVNQSKAASDIMGGTKPQQAFDPQMMMKMSELAANALKGSQASRDEALKTIASLQNAQAARSTDLTKEQMANNSAEKVAEINAAGMNRKLNAAATEKARDAMNTLNVATSKADDLAKQFDPKFFLTSEQLKDKAGDWLAKKGLDLNQDERKDLDNFFSMADNVAHDYIKAMNPKAFSNQKGLDELSKTLVNKEMDPTKAKINIVNMLAELSVKQHVQENYINSLASSGRDLSNPRVDTEVLDKVKSLPPEVFQHARDSVIAKYPQLAPNPGSGSPSNVPIHPAFQNPQAKQQAAALLAQRAAANGQ